LPEAPFLQAMASKPEDRDPGHRSEETGPVKV
jgi:hypothetical protein